MVTVIAPEDTGDDNVAEEPRLSAAWDPGAAGGTDRGGGRLALTTCPINDTNWLIDRFATLETGGRMTGGAGPGKDVDGWVTGLVVRCW